MPERITGMIAATLTPYHGGGSVNLDRVAEHVGYLAAGGIPAIAPAGTTGEFLYLSEAEKAAVVKTAVEASGGRMRVIAGVWAASAEGVASLARQAEHSGAAAVFLTTPIYYPATDEAVIEWYRAARKHTGLPLLAYSIPQYAVNAVTVRALRVLMEEGTIQGIKDSTGKEDRVQDLLNLAAGRMAVYGASDSFALRARSMGVDGFISALANIYPQTCARIWQGDAAAQAAVDRVRSAVKGYGGIGGLKALLRAKGLDFGPTRLPFADLTTDETRELLSTVEALGDLS